MSITEATASRYFSSAPLCACSLPEISQDCPFYAAAPGSRDSHSLTVSIQASIDSLFDFAEFLGMLARHSPPAPVPVLLELAVYVSIRMGRGTLLRSPTVVIFCCALASTSVGSSDSELSLTFLATACFRGILAIYGWVFVAFGVEPGRSWGAKPGKFRL